MSVNEPRIKTSGKRMETADERNTGSDVVSNALSQTSPLVSETHRTVPERTVSVRVVEAPDTEHRPWHLMEAAPQVRDIAEILPAQAAMDGAQAGHQIADRVPGDIAEPDAQSAGDLRPWHLMEAAPLDGTMIEVKEDPDDPDVSAVLVRYYRTSVRDHDRRKWVPAAWWRTAITGEKLAFEPFLWRMPEGFSTPGLIVA